MRSTRSRASRQPRSFRADEGSAVVEFSMIAVLVSAIFLVVLQVGIYLYQRSVIASSAMAAARYAANANVATEEGGARATVLISEALSEQTASEINCTSADESGANGLAVVAVTCGGAIPSVVTALGSLLPIDVTARVIAEGQ